MRINKKILPIKAHFFFFMAAMGPILPQLPVYGKELGISPVVMGSVTGILPFVFLLAKPAFGMLVDVYRDYRKTIFMMLIVIMITSFGLMNFIPSTPMMDMRFDNLDISSLDLCNNSTMAINKLECNTKDTLNVICSSNCLIKSEVNFLATKQVYNNFSQPYKLLCSLKNISQLLANNSTNCDLECLEDLEIENGCLYKSLTFWSFILLMSLGTITYNVTNSISDAICFDVIGDQYDYGKQRVWGTIGFGTTALIAGYAVNFFSGSTISYAPAFIIMLVCSVMDLFSCIKLKLPIIESPENIFKDLKELLDNRHVITFIIFAVFAGVLDSLIIYFLFWYLEDLALVTNTSNVKLIEGLVVAAETLGGEVIFFSISGKILERFGHVHCFSMCFFTYAVRLGLISVVPSPWYIIPVEFCFQGPTYALTYTTIVAYANELAPPGASATMQGIAAGMDDGVGFAIGSIIGGLLYKYIGGRHTLRTFAGFGIICGILHLVLHRTILQKHDLPEKNVDVQYKNPEDALKVTYDVID